jgi:hypothetical protein
MALTRVVARPPGLFHLGHSALQRSKTAYLDARKESKVRVVSEARRFEGHSADGHGLLVQLASTLEVAEGAAGLGEIVHRPERIEVVVADNPSATAESLLEHLAGFVEVPVLPAGHGQPVHRVEGAGVVVAKYPLPSSQACSNSVRGCRWSPSWLGRCRWLGGLGSRLGAVVAFALLGCVVMCCNQRLQERYV